MARIVKATRSGEPTGGMLRFGSWAMRPTVRRSRLSINRLRKANPADALGLGGVETIVRDPVTGLTIPNGVDVNGTRNPRVVKKQANMTTGTARGTKRVSTPSPTSGGGVRNLYRNL